MAIVRVYVDSSVWNSALDSHAPELQRQTDAFFSSIRVRNDVKAYISDVVLGELAHAPAERMEKIAQLIRRIAPQRVDLDEEASQLADAYVEHGVLTGGHVVDARHVAIATIARLEVLTSWNYRHLVNRRRREAFNGVNSLRGYRPIEIISPPEVFDE